MQGESIEPFAQTQAVADQIRAFAAGIFRHASDGVIISLRIFAEGDKSEKPLAIQGIPINGGGLEPPMEAAISQARFAATHTKRAVFCPPVAGFNNYHK